MGKRKQDPITGERPAFALIPATEFSPTVDKSCPVFFTRVLKQKLIRSLPCVFE